MMLVYNLPAAEALFGEGLHTCFVGLNGSAYVVGGFGFTAARYDQMGVLPIRTGGGARPGGDLGCLTLPRDPPGTRSQGPRGTAPGLHAAGCQLMRERE